MGKDDFFKHKAILLLDKDAKQTNDRTWCFWEKGEGQFDTILYKTWDHIYFGGQKFSDRLSIAPYRYKMIRGIDFYDMHLEQMSSYANITFSQGYVTGIDDSGDHVIVSTETEKYTAKIVLNSIFDYKMAMAQQKYPVLQQHFIGWFIETKTTVFRPDQATFMDFSIPQKGNTRFMYLLPLSKTSALVEYTLFSEKVLPEEEYEKAISAYIENDLSTTDYKIVEKERGNIPMTCYDFSQHNSTNVLHIGTAGGWAKASTGYTFMSTTKKVPAVLKHLKSGKAMNTLRFKNKFWYYDLLLLDILSKENHLGQSIFESPFEKRKPRQIFKFLDEETNLFEDILLMNAPAPWPFIKALLGRLF